MATLTILGKETLEVLEQLEYRCEQFELHNDGEFEGEIKVMISDVHVPLRRSEDLYDIAKLLQKNGIDFSVTFDLINDIVEMHIDSEHPSPDYIQLGIIRGKDIKTIKESITNFKVKLGVSGVLLAVPVKVGISFESKRGFYLTDNPALCYAIGPTTRRLRLIKLLNKAIHSVTIPLIKSKIGYKSKIKQNTTPLIKKEIKGINILFKEKLKVSEDFIISNESGGYSLNREKFTVQNL